MSLLTSSLNTAKLLAQSSPFGGPITPPTDAFSKGSTDINGATGNLEHFISNAIGMLTILAGLGFIFYFVNGGLNWVMAGGEKGKIEKAREQMIQAVIGMIVIVISYGLIGIVGTFLGINILTPGQSIINLNPLGPGH